MTPERAGMNLAWAEQLIGALAHGGACVFCVSPGSRSTPLTVAAARIAGDRCVVHYDERGAGFHALGWAQATGRAAVLISTSGSAAANYWPAVTEASAARLPLIILTADRPPELLDCGANQAIDQAKLFGGYARWHAALPCPDPAMPAGYLGSTAAQALHRAMGPPAGPVHLNCMFREPLLDDAEAPAEWRTAADSGTRAPYLAPVLAPETDAAARVAARALEARRGLIVAGWMPCAEDAAATLRLARRLGWPLLPDLGSGLRMGQPDAPVIAAHDQMLLSDRARAALAPDVALHFGGPVVSKRLQQFLAETRPHYTLVADHPFRQDPSHQVNERIVSNIARCCAAIEAALPEQAEMPERTAALHALSRRAEDAAAAWLGGRQTLTEMGVARSVSLIAPAGSVVFAGNSMPVRDLDMYAASDGAVLRVALHRGASGIDGNVAAAAGFARARGGPVTLVLGDLALLHDLNSLALVRDAGAPVIIVVVNNDGGGIFSFLPAARAQDVFERFFGTPHGLGFAGAAAMFGLAHARPTDPAAFEAAYRRALAEGVPAIIEARTDRAENVRDHAALQSAVRAALETDHA